jgi:hypothetical protein
MENRLRQTVQSIEGTPAEQIAGKASKDIDRRTGLANLAGFISNTYNSMSNLDKAALFTAPVPVLGDIVGFAADTKTFIEDPTLTNAGLGIAGLLPFVPSGTLMRAAKKGYGGVKEGVKSSAQKAVANIRNDIPGFYKSGATKPEQVMSVARTIPEGLANLVQGRYSPKARAIQQEFNISVADKKASTRALKVSEQETANIEKLTKALEKAKKSGANTTKIEEAIKASRQKATTEAKKAMGQLNQSRSFSNQYYGPEGGSVGFLRNIDNIDHIKTFPKFNVDDYYTEVGKVSGMPIEDINEIFKQIQTLPAIGMNPNKNYQMNIRRTHTGSSGNIDYSPTAKIFSGKSLEDLQSDLFPTKYNKVTGKIIKSKSYTDDKVFLKALQDSKINVLNPEEVLKGKSAVITGSGKTDAFELGGVNYMSAINKDGKVVSIVNDEHDLFNVKLPGGERYMNVSEPIVKELKESKKNLTTAEQETAKQVLKNKKEMAVAKAIKEYEKVPGVDISGKVPVGFNSREQWARAQAVSKLKPSSKDYSRVQKETYFVGQRAAKPLSKTEEEEQGKVNKKRGGSVVERNPYANYQPKAI